MKEQTGKKINNGTSGTEKGEGMTPIEIVRENLKALERKTESVQKRRKAHLTELARLILSASCPDRTAPFEAGQRSGSYPFYRDRETRDYPEADDTEARGYSESDGTQYSLSGLSSTYGFQNRSKLSERSVRSAGSGSSGISALSGDSEHSGVPVPPGSTFSGGVSAKNAPEAVPMINQIDQELLLSSYSELTAGTKLSAEEKAVVCDCLWEALGKSGMSHEELVKLFFEASEEESDENAISFVYGRASDQAAKRFSEALGGILLKEASSFREACDDVFFSRSAYCVLPVMNGTEGRLSGFCSLIDRYDLKTVMRTEVVLSDSSRTEFALLKKSIEYIKPTVGEMGTGLQISISAMSGEQIASLITAASSFGVTVKRIDTFPTEYSDGVYVNEFFCRISHDASLGGFFLYLFLEFPQFVPKGIFPIIDFTVK